MSTGTVAQYAVCRTCGESWANYLRHAARKAAYAHAQKTGHTVHVETTIVTKYN